MHCTDTLVGCWYIPVYTGVVCYVGVEVDSIWSFFVFA